ncbi:18609_t:CDS:2, partial [Racocetra persica]
LTYRYVTDECEVAGYKWPAGTNFHLNIFAVHVTEFWIDPKAFNPDRFYNYSPPDLMFLYISIYNADLVNINEPLKIFTSGLANCKELK